MGNVHAKRLKGGSSFQTEGNKIMQLAELLRPHITKWLQGYKNKDGLPVQPATIRAISLNTAQKLLKQSS